MLLPKSDILSTRLIIEPLDSLEYLLEMQALFACPTAMRYYESGNTWLPEKTLEVMSAKIARAKCFDEKGIDSLPWWIVKSRNENFIGLIGTFKKETLSAPGTYHIDVCCISKPEYWGQYIMFEAMIHLGYALAPQLKEMNDKIPLRYSTHVNNIASLKLGAIFSQKKLFDMPLHPNGARFRWQVEQRCFREKKAETKARLKAIFEHVWGIRSLTPNQDHVIPKDFRNEKGSFGEEIIDIVQYPKVLKTSSHKSPFEVCVRTTSSPVTVFVSVLDEFDNLVELYRSQGPKPFYRKYVEFVGETTIKYPQLRLCLNPACNLSIKCQVYHCDKLISQVYRNGIKTPKKRNRNEHPKLAVITTYDELQQQTEQYSESSIGGHAKKIYKVVERDDIQQDFTDLITSPDIVALDSQLDTDITKNCDMVPELLDLDIQQGNIDVAESKGRSAEVHLSPHEASFEQSWVTVHTHFL